MLNSCVYNSFTTSNIQIYKYIALAIYSIDSILLLSKDCYLTLLSPYYSRLGASKKYRYTLPSSIRLLFLIVSSSI